MSYENEVGCNIFAGYKYPNGFVHEFGSSGIYVG